MYICMGLLIITFPASRNFGYTILCMCIKVLLYYSITFIFSITEKQ
jgi:hypothetical protein